MSMAGLSNGVEKFLEKGMCFVNSSSELHSRGTGNS